MPAMPTNRAGAAAIADIIGTEPGVLTVVVAQATGIEAAIECLVEEYEFSFDGSGANKAKISGATSIHDLIEELSNTSPEDVYIIKGIENWPPGQIEKLDLLRNALMGRARVVIVTTSEGAAQLSDGAPNLWSWIGSRCFELEASFGVMDQAARLESLRNFFRISDDEVIRLAEARELPLDPAFAEWLILLGRGDLLGK